MTTLMKGSEVAAAMKEKMLEEVSSLKQEGISPQLAIVRVGARQDDLSYERSAIKRMEGIGIACKVFEFDESITQEYFEKEFEKINNDQTIHGILVFRPLPKHLSEEPIKRIINPFKDVDCMSPINIAKVFSGDDTGFAPCTSEAVMEMLEHYSIGLEGKRVTVVGRSMVVGKPLSMLLLKKNATVTICHTRTKDIEAECQSAEILIAAAGKAKMIGPLYVGEKSIIVDVGINVDDSGNLCGDVDFESVSPLASFITPVPGGVGTVTTSVLAKHIIRAADYLRK